MRDRWLLPRHYRLAHLRGPATPAVLRLPASPDRRTHLHSQRNPEAPTSWRQRPLQLHWPDPNFNTGWHHRGIRRDLLCLNLCCSGIRRACLWCLVLTINGSQSWNNDFIQALRTLRPVPGMFFPLGAHWVWLPPTVLVVPHDLSYQPPLVNHRNTRIECHEHRTLTKDDNYSAFSTALENHSNLTPKNRSPASGHLETTSRSSRRWAGIKLGATRSLIPTSSSRNATALATRGWPRSSRSPSLTPRAARSRWGSRRRRWRCRWSRDAASRTRTTPPSRTSATALRRTTMQQVNFKLRWNDSTSAFLTASIKVGS